MVLGGFGSCSCLVVSFLDLGFKCQWSWLNRGLRTHANLLWAKRCGNLFFGDDGASELSLLFLFFFWCFFFFKCSFALKNSESLKCSFLLLPPDLRNRVVEASSSWTARSTSWPPTMVGKLKTSTYDRLAASCASCASWSLFKPFWPLWLVEVLGFTMKAPAKGKLKLWMNHRKQGEP